MSSLASGAVRPAAVAAADAPARRFAFLLGLAPVVLAAIVYFPITRNFFFADDFLHLYQLADGTLLEFVLQPHSGHVYVVRNLIFFLCDAAFGTHPAGYFWLMLVTHLLNVALLFLVLRAYLGSEHLACVGATAWGVCPLAEGTLGWYSVYGQALATTLVLALLLDVHRAGTVSTTRALAWVGTLVVGMTCFGTAVGAALAFPVLVALLAPGAFRRWPARILLVLTPAIVAGVYIGLHALYVRLYGEHGVPLQFQVALARAGGWWPLANMLVNLIASGLAGVFFLFLFHLADYPNVASNVLAAVFTVAWVVALVRATPTGRRQLLAFLVLALATYGTIAAGRGTILQNRGALAAIVPRYHYTGTAALTLLACAVLGWLPIRLGARIKDALLWGALATIVALYLASSFHIDPHADAEAEVARTLTGFRRLAAAAGPGQPVTIPNERFFAVGPIIPLQRFPGWAGLFEIYAPTNELDGHPVRFVTSNADALALARQGGRVATLLSHSGP